MKNLPITILCALLAFGSAAQYDPEALAVLDAMSGKYKQIDAYEVAFTQKLTNKEANLDDEIAASIVVKGEKFVIDIAGQKIFNNGTDVYAYSEELAEVTISTYDPDDSEISLGNVYDLYKEGFKYALISKMGNGDRVIELDPESRDKSYFKIRMIIDGKDSLKSFTVFERSGNIFEYSINTFEEVDISDQAFTFDASKYPGVEVIDFR